MLIGHDKAMKSESEEWNRGIEKWIQKVEQRKKHPPPTKAAIKKPIQSDLVLKP